MTGLLLIIFSVKYDKLIVNRHKEDNGCIHKNTSTF